MFTYAGGSFITGQLGDRFSPVAVVAGGLLGSTICLLLIVFGASTSIIHNAAFCGTWFLTCQLLHGAFQATGGPVRLHIIIGLAFSLCVLFRSILPLWEIGSLQKEEGWFSACGLAINTLEILPLLSSLVGFYTLVMIGDGASLSQLLLTVFGHSLTCGLFQTAQKRQGKGQLFSGFFFYDFVGRVITENSKANVVSSAGKSETKQVEAIGFIEAFQLPNVMSYAIAFGFFKLVSYSLSHIVQFRLIRDIVG